MLGLGDTQTSQTSKILTDDRATHHDKIAGDSQIMTDREMIGSGEVSNNLTYDWGKDLQWSKAFEIPNSEPNSLTDQQLVADQWEQFEAAFMVQEHSVSGIAESTSSSKTPPCKPIFDVEENFIDDISTLTDISSITVNNAPRNHVYGKERVGKKGSTYNELYNAALNGEFSSVKDILKRHSTTLMPDENGQTPLYAACFGMHIEIVKLLIEFEYDVNHQDKEGKTPLHITFENHAPDLAQTLITQYKANTEIRDK